jgi:transcriptional regulator with AAA-type ATPase domain/polyferredoxin
VTTTQDEPTVPPQVAGVPTKWLPSLEMVQGSAEPGSLVLGAGPVRIGRGAGNDIALADARASRHHAAVIRDGWSHVLVDLHSLNGVVVNGARVERAVLEPGSRIEIGGTAIVFRRPVPDISRAARRSLLATSELLAALAAETQDEMAGRLVPRVVPSGTVVVRAGQPVPGMILVHAGRLRVVDVNDEGGERLVARLGPGDSFGQSLPMPGQHAEHSLIADADACVFEIPAAELAGLVAGEPAEARRVIETAREMLVPPAEVRPAAALPHPKVAARTAPASVIVGNDARIVRAQRAVETLARDNRPVLIVGPAGSGKRLFARHFHRAGPHAAKPYVELSVAGLEPTRVLAAVVGTEGRATNPAAGEIGALELLGDGTLAICHAELLDTHQQCVIADYLRFGWFHRDHGETSVSSRVRIAFVATGSEQEVVARLAPPLLALLSDRVVALPSLAQRVKDIPILAEHLLEIHAGKAGKSRLTLSRETIDKLLPYPWPGNVSELDSVMQRAAILAADGSEVPADLVFVVPPEEEAFKVNLLRDDRVRTALRGRWLIPSLTWICMGFIGLVAVTALWGALAPAGHPLADAATNPAMMVTWLLWFPMLPLVTAGVGRIWCAVCPIAGFGDLAARIDRLNRPVPGWLKRSNGWTLVGAYVAIECAEGFFGVDSSPAATLGFLAVLIVLAVEMTVVFERRAFCRYLCPLAGWLGAYASLSPIEIRGNRKVCQTQCGEHSCFKGTETVPGCPMFLYPAAMSSNAECLLCTNCVRSCQNRGVQLNLRPPLVELWRNPASTLSLSMLAMVLLGVMSSHWLTKLPFWKALKANPPLPSDLFRVVFLVGCIAGVVLAFAAASLFSGGASRERPAANMARYGVAFIPLAFAAHASLMLKGLLSTDVPTMWAWVRGHVFASAAAAAAGTSAAGAGAGSLFDPALVSFIQGLTLMAGVGASLVVIVMIARTVERSAVAARAFPHLVLALVMGFGLMYCLVARAPSKSAAPAAPAAVHTVGAIARPPS